MSDRITIAEKTYDGLDLSPHAQPVHLRCKNCGATDSLVENTLVPRSMGAAIYQLNGEHIADLDTSYDEAYWEAESDHKWGCQTCVSEGQEISDLFEVVNV